MFNIFMKCDEINTDYRFQLPKGIGAFAKEKYKLELDQLYHGELVVLPLTQEGEEQREHLYETQRIGRYGCDEYNFTFKGNVYLAILVNND